MSITKIENLQNILENEFKWFHKHPELSFEEFETTKRIKTILEKENIEILPLNLKTGLVAVIKGTAIKETAENSENGKNGKNINDKKKIPVIAIRGDIDALPVHEETDLPYKSLFDNKMHACGHDYHLTSIIGTALLLNRNKDKLNGTVKLIFQPAEEIFSGATHIIESGALDDVDLIFGLHCNSQFPVGTVGIKEGAVSAAVDRFQIKLHGFGSHAAHPDLGTDPIVAATSLVNSLQTIISRNSNPFAANLISVTHLKAGNTWNVIPEDAFIEGTVRTLDKAQRELVKNRIFEITEFTSKAYKVEQEINWITGPPATDNDLEWADFLKKIAISENLEVGRPNDTLGGEDFAFYQEKIKGVFIHIGTDKTYPNHHPKFKINTDALELTSNFLASIAENVLNKLFSESEVKNK